MEKKFKVISVIISIAIIILLFYAGPADAFILGLAVKDPIVTKGDIVEFKVSTQIELTEMLDIDKFILVLNGSEIQECEFDVDGNILNGCKGITITKLASSNSTFGSGYSYGYGYGYGYGNGVLEYKIKLDTGEYLSGIYHTSLKMIIGGDEFEEIGEDIVIGVESMNGCSLRAKGGDFSTEEISATNNKLSLNIPLRNAVNGKGHIITQYKNGRVVYQFDVISVIENDEDHAVLMIDGLIRFKGEDKVQENSVIYLDKVNMVINVDGSNFELDEMPVYFMNRC